MAIEQAEASRGRLRQLREPDRSERAGGLLRGGEATSLCLGKRSVRERATCNEAGVAEGGANRGHRLAAPEGVVVLALACASFDWFRDYTERGQLKEKWIGLRRA